jgi:hypothetical protein
MNRYDVRCAWTVLVALFASAVIGAGVPPNAATASATVSASPLASSKAPPVSAQLAPFDVTYDVSLGGFGVGQMNIRLEPQGEAGCYRYTIESHPNMFVSAIYGSPNQLSLFCVRDGVIRSQHFESVLPGDDKQSYKLDFDWNRHVVSDDKGGVREIPDDAIDSIALQQLVRLWVRAHANDANPPIAEFTMVDRKNLTHYKFKLTGHEKVETPAGSFDTLRLERIDNPNKIGRFWAAPARDYIPVITETKSDRKPMVRMELAR